MTNPNQGTKGTKEINKDYDEFENQGKQINLVPESSNVFRDDKVGL